MIVDQHGVEVSDGAYYNGPLPIFEIEVEESTAAWEDECGLAENIACFEAYNRKMRLNVIAGTTF